MPSFLLHKTDASAIGHGVRLPSARFLPPAPEGWAWIETPTPPWNYTVAFVDGKVTVVPLALAS